MLEAPSKSTPTDAAHGVYDMKPSRGKNEHQYQKLWQHWQQYQQVAAPLTQQTAKVLVTVLS